MVRDGVLLDVLKETLDEERPPVPLYDNWDNAEHIAKAMTWYLYENGWIKVEDLLKKKTPSGEAEEIPAPFSEGYTVPD